MWTADVHIITDTNDVDLLQDDHPHFHLLPSHFHHLTIAMQVAYTWTMDLRSRNVAATGHCVIINIFKSGHVAFRHDSALKQNIMSIQSKLRSGETSERLLLMFALVSTEWTPEREGAIAKMLLFKCPQEVRADLDCRISFDYTLFGPAVKATGSCLLARKIQRRRSKEKKAARHNVEACC